MHFPGFFMPKNAFEAGTQLGELSALTETPYHCFNLLVEFDVQVPSSDQETQGRPCNENPDVAIPNPLA